MHPVTAHSQGANPPRRCLCLCLYYNLFPARCSRVVRALFVRVRTRCSYAVRALFVRVRVRCSRVVRTLFVRCSYAVRTSSHERELTRELRDAPVCHSHFHWQVMDDGSSPLAPCVPRGWLHRDGVSSAFGCFLCGSLVPSLSHTAQ